MQYRRNPSSRLGVVLRGVLFESGLLAADADADAADADAAAAER